MMETLTDMLSYLLLIVTSPISIPLIIAKLCWDIFDEDNPPFSWREVEYMALTSLRTILAQEITNNPKRYLRYVFEYNGVRFKVITEGIFTRFVSIDQAVLATIYYYTVVNIIYEGLPRNYVRVRP